LNKKYGGNFDDIGEKYINFVEMGESAV